MPPPEQCFCWVVRGLYATCTLTRRPTQAYLCEHKSASRCLRRCLRGHMLSSSVEVHCGSSSWKIATSQYKCSFGSSGSKTRNAVQVRIPHLSKDLAARNSIITSRKPTRMPTQGLRGAHAKTAEQTEGRQKKQIPSYVANSHDLFNKRLRYKPTRGVT